MALAPHASGKLVVKPIVYKLNSQLGMAMASNKPAPFVSIVTHKGDKK